MSFAYQAFDRAGKSITGTLDAPGVEQARAQLTARGLFVVELGTSRTGGSGTSRAEAPMRSPRGKQLTHTAALARQLSVLLSTGTAVAEAISAAARQARDEKVKSVLLSVRAMVEEGVSLADAMRRHPAMFDPVMCSLVAAGEASGRLDVMLTRVATMARQQLTVTRAVKGALIYPAVLISISIIVSLIMLVVVVPRFAGMFEAMQAPLPATTEMLLSISAALRGYWWIALPSLLIAVFGGYFWSRTAQGHVAIDAALLRLPGIGDLVKSLSSARIARLLGVLLDARVPLLDALGLVEASTPSPAYRRLIRDAAEAVIDGNALSVCFAESSLITPAVGEAVRNGEASARLGEVLHNVAQHLDEDNTAAVKNVTTLIEPAIILGMGVFVGIIAISMFLPLFDLTASAGRG